MTALTQDSFGLLEKTEPTGLAALVLRVTLGIVMLAHSIYLKLMVFTLAGTASFFESLGLPAAAAYLVFTIEAAAGFTLLIGYKVRLTSLFLIPVLIGATWAHWSSGWLFTNENGGWEYPLFLVMAAVVQLLLGAGIYSFDNKSSTPLNSKAEG